MFNQAWQWFVMAWRELRAHKATGGILAALTVPPVWLAMAVGGSVVNLVSIACWAVSVAIALRVADGRGADLRGSFPRVMTLVRLLLAVLVWAVPLLIIGALMGALPSLAGVLTIVGALLAVVITAQWALLGYVFIDQAPGLGVGLRRSFALLLRVPLPWGVWILLAGALNIAGMLPFTLGLLVTMPLSVVAGARAYRDLSAGAPEGLS